MNLEYLYQCPCCFAENSDTNIRKAITEIPHRSDCMFKKGQAKVTFNAKKIINKDTGEVLRENESKTGTST